jgi:tRNA-guanine transglycosylase
MRQSLEKTHRWAKLCLDAKRTNQALYGIVQGGAFKHLREESAQTIGAMDFNGFGIGGEFGYDKKSMGRMLSAIHAKLPDGKPRHVLGVGHPEDFAVIAKSGGDTFDCIAPTHYARRGTLFTSRGRLDITKRALLSDQNPIDPKCKCDVCQNYSRAYVCHLMRAKDLTGMKLATIHNIYFFNALAKDIRRKIKNDEL